MTGWCDVARSKVELMLPLKVDYFITFNALEGGRKLLQSIGNDDYF